MPDFLTGLDRWFFEAVNEGQRNLLFNAIMPLLSNKHYFLVPGLLGGALLAWRGGAKARWAVGGCLLAVLLADQGALWIKGLVARPRPCHSLLGISLRAGCTDSFAFPSSHATNMFALAAVLGYHYRRWSWALGALAAAVAYSRVYLGVHYPGDALGGALLGVGMGALALAASEAVRCAWRRHQEERIVSPEHAGTKE
jgi:undecaprenyl-diphosphatase